MNGGSSTCCASPLRSGTKSTGLVRLLREYKGQRGSDLCILQTIRNSSAHTGRSKSLVVSPSIDLLTWGGDRVFYDDVDEHGRSGGGGYAKYGIDPHLGAIVVVRPDGYVGIVTGLNGVEDLNAYFDGFMKAEP